VKGRCDVYTDKGKSVFDFFMLQEAEMTTIIDWQQAPLVNGSFQEGSIVEEVSLLLEPSLLERLEKVAGEHGMAAASLIRRLLREFLHHSVPTNESPELAPVSIPRLLDTVSADPMVVTERMADR
jgi:hypothetical protein